MGLVVRLTVTPLESAPEDDSQIAKFAVPPGFTLEPPEKRSTLSHSLTGVGVAAKTAVSRIAVPGPAAAAAADGVDVPPDADADADADTDTDGDVDVDGGGGRAGDGGGDDGGGVGVVDVDPDGDGCADVGAGLGVIVPVTHGGGAARTRDALVLPMVTAVVAMTAPTMHKPVAAPATADPCLRTLTRLTPFLRSSVEGSSCTRYRHTMSYLRVVLGAYAWLSDTTTRAEAAVVPGRRHRAPPRRDLDVIVL